MNTDYIICIVGVVAVILTVIGELRRKDRRLLWVRITTSVIAVGSLVCMIVPLRIKTKIFAADHTAVLLTQGYTEDSVRSFLQKQGNNTKVFSSDKNIVERGSKFSVRYAATAKDILSDYPETPELHVFGYGFAAHEFFGMNEPFYFHPSSLPRGIHFIRWQEHIKEGKEFSVEGTVDNSNHKNAKLVLQVFGRVLDSITIAADTKTSFKLKTLPKTTGKILYSAALISGKDTIDQGAVPVVIEKADKTNVLILASSPGFENNFLKNWLAEHRYNVAMRSLVSSNKFHTSYYNINNVNVNSINSSVLQNFDIVAADASGLSSMSKAEIEAIRNGTEKGELGLIVNFDTITRNSFFANPFLFGERTFDSSRSLLLQLPDSSVKLPALQTQSKIYLRNTANAQPFVTDRQGAHYAAAALYGSSAIIATTVTNSFTWKLSGQTNAYDRYWTAVLEKASNHSGDQSNWRISPFIIRAHEPAHLQLETSNAGVPRWRINNEPMHFMQDVLFPYQWSVTYHPLSNGWQTLENIGTGESIEWYVHDKNSWENVSAAEKISVTRSAAQHTNASTEGRQERTVQTKPVPKVIFLLLFLISAVFLWIENRRRGKG